MWDICLGCEGECCEGFFLSHVVEGERVSDDDFIKDYMRENHPYFTHWGEDEGWSCNHHVEGKCDIYDERPEFCSDYYCDKYNVMQECMIGLGMI